MADFSPKANSDRRARFLGKVPVKAGLVLAGAEGLEPTTLGFGDRCSTN